MPGHYDDPDQREGRTPSTRFFLVLIVGLLAAFGLLVLLWAIA